jgi:peptide/nickel transport system permease protein
MRERESGRAREPGSSVSAVASLAPPHGVAIAPSPALPLPHSPTPRLLRRAWKQKGSVIGAAVVLLVVLLAILAPFVAPANPYVGKTIDRLLPPVWLGGQPEFILGTDQLGRDLWARLAYGARVSLTVGVLAVLISSAIGVLLGLLAGYYRRWVDWLISTGVNVMLTFPFVLLALAVIAVLGPSFSNLIVVLAITGWPIYTRVVRSQGLSLREREFVTAARVLGAGDPRIIFRHVFPNVVNSLVVIASLQVAQMIILESFLSFLGLGVQPPIPSWGSMLGDGRLYMFDKWWMATFPGLAIFITTLAINLVGDGLRDLLDPYSRTNY